MINPKQETYYILSYEELDDLINQHFGKEEFSSVAAYEWSNDACHANEVSIQELEESKFAQSELKEFMQHPNIPQYPVHWSYLLADLAKRGEVPEGNYLIEVSW
jgi:hypothetical protein